MYLNILYKINVVCPNVFLGHLLASAGRDIVFVILREENCIIAFGIVK